MSRKSVVYFWDPDVGKFHYGKHLFSFSTLIKIFFLGFNLTLLFSESVTLKFLNFMSIAIFIPHKLNFLVLLILY